jgi:hypothetical protein
VSRYIVWHVAALIPRCKRNVCHCAFHSSHFCSPPGHPLNQLFSGTNFLIVFQSDPILIHPLKRFFSSPLNGSIGVILFSSAPENSRLSKLQHKNMLKLIVSYVLLCLKFFLPRTILLNRNLWNNAFSKTVSPSSLCSFCVHPFPIGRTNLPEGIEKRNN